MSERQRPYVPAQTLGTEYPVSKPFRAIGLVLNIMESSSTVTRMCLLRWAFSWILKLH